MTQRRLCQSLILLSSVALLAGCVSKRGIDFGHWALQGEHINTIRIFESESRKNLTGKERVLLLPVMDGDAKESRAILQAQFFRSMKTYLPVRVVLAEENNAYTSYLQEDNLIAPDGQFDVSEAGRIGKLHGATHVLCVGIREWQQYPPQTLALTITMIDCASQQVILAMDATFDASEQQVVMALGDHLQRRKAMKYSDHSLDTLLRSPTKYAMFVASQCNRAIAAKLWPRIELKKETQQADTKEGTR
jgi:hypothetical protein